MKSIYPVTLLIVSLSACSSMRDMSSSGSGSSYEEPFINYNSTSYPVTDPRTGRMTYYHGG